MNYMFENWEKHFPPTKFFPKHFTIKLSGGERECCTEAQHILYSKYASVKHWAAEKSPFAPLALQGGLRLEPLILKPNPWSPGNSRQSRLTYKHLVKIALPLSRPTHTPGTAKTRPQLTSGKPEHSLPASGWHEAHVGGHCSCCDSGGGCWRGVATIHQL